ncbi:UDP-glucose/GDP-mannose dehydrogenase family protein [Methanosarcina sp.]|uniref:UDP-glucose dehydrogenase family protein n=1 Tax=Methanosarcina sp. TaxID=2213 RepID=UPI002988DC29|nr:UDP-glucose/GDP-mannose dehydrogenase family protein [Methanosarcina sp.]MDW5548938.1 UDP-glucose/GDP-mannose dehydrogenase family protein [Methanosarcina sp.]MDW5552641.1 UDP-glucose/GDP-mannose dehydrogenase family protein [Methanosarcina sp.]MDW5559197.1 UDP-glucose/GDP-mannose dehydrogenase family protein [Methanosarcina sp.]
MKISVIGSGYVGSVTAACFAEVGHEVVCVDIDKKKMDQINAGISPIYEEGLEELLQKYAGKSLTATTDYEYAITNTDISFICVGTPSAEDGSIDLSIVRAATASIGAVLAKKEGYHVVVVKSTVVPETTEKFVLPILEEISGKIAGKDFGVAMNPEFLREGKAVYDFMHPDKIVVGAIDKKSGDLVSELYRTFKCEVTHTSLSTAEMIKYANNSLLATKISFANEIGNICKRLNVDTYEVMEAVGKDSRISPRFLNSGAGFGGSCFPKDVKALIGKAKEIGYSPDLLESVIAVNEKQPILMTEILQRKIGSLAGKKIAVLGLAFKNDTDDIRESRAIPVIAELLRLGAEISAYDPMATENMKRIFPTIEYSEKAKDALKSADACLVMTEWDEFNQLDSEFEGMKEKIVIDGRRIIKAKNIDCEGLCW